MKRQKKNSTPERLLLGLAMGLAGSLCALEYGRPLIEQHKYLGAIEESISYMEDLPPLTFPKPKQQMEPEIVKSKPNTTELDSKDNHLIRSQKLLKSVIPSLNTTASTMMANIARKYSAGKRMPIFVPNCAPITELVNISSAKTTSTV